MILRTGKRRRRDNTISACLATKSGFTLIELLLVAIITLALTTLSTPIFKRTYDDLRLASCAKEMASVLRFCRERAVFERRLFRVVIDRDKKTYQIFAETGDEDRLAPLKSSWGRAFRIPDSVLIDVETDTLDFLPDGTTTGISIYLINKKDMVKTVSLGSDTGVITIYDYKKE